MVVWNPFTLVYDIGFQLSVVATGGLLLLTPLVSRRLLWIQHSFARELVASSVSAYIAVLPLIVYLTGFVSFVSIPANILVLPAVPIAMLASFIIALIAIVAPVFAVALASIAVAPLAWIVFVAQTLFTTGIAGVSVTSVSILMPIIAYAIMGIVYFFEKKKLLHARLDDAPIGVR